MPKSSQVSTCDDLGTSVGFSQKNWPELFTLKSVYRLTEATEKVAEGLIFWVRLQFIHTLAIKNDYTHKNVHTVPFLSFLYICVWTASHLIIFVPGQGLGGEDKPVLLGSSLHDADVVDGQPALPDHLRHRQTHRQKANNNKKNIHQIKNLNFSHTFHKHRIRQPVHVTHTHTHVPTQTCMRQHSKM